MTSHTAPPTPMVWTSVLTYNDGTHDVEVLDGKPTESFLDGLSDLDVDINYPRRLVAWEIREGYVNGGDSAVIHSGQFTEEATMSNHHTPTHPELAKLADAILELENPGEAGTLLEALHDVLAPSGWDELAHMMEVCPVHLCDEQICRDDNADCPAGRGEE